MFVNFCTFFICFAYKLADCFAINLILYECSFYLYGSDHHIPTSLY